nr:MAG TPA: hypothetical protein [Bacteriophage sp.]
MPLQYLCYYNNCPCNNCQALFNKKWNAPKDTLH